MKRLFRLLGVLVLLGSAVVLGQAGKPASTDAAARSLAIQLFQSLTDEQKKLALRDAADPARHVMEYAPKDGTGLPYGRLTAEQKMLVDDLVRAIASEQGAARLLEVAKEMPENKRYVNFFGAPSAHGPFVWRLAQHHLNLVYLDFGKEPAQELGTIYVGASPASALWNEEEKTAVELFHALTPEEAKSVQGPQGKSETGLPIGMAGLRLGDLTEKPRALARKLLEQRLTLFSADRQKILRALIQKDGGRDNLRLAFWGDASKPRGDGGTGIWKIGSTSFLCDWETMGIKHIHSTVRGGPAAP